jgi:cysteine synthase A
MSRYVMQKDGIFIGSSSAVNLVATVKTALSMGPGHRLVTLLCDGGHRHLTKFWNDDFIASIGLNSGFKEILEFL